MENASKILALALILIMAISGLGLLIVKPACAQTPSIPIFSVNTVSGSYIVPTTYSTNQYTGANITNLGYTVCSFNITIKIQNEPATSAYLLEIKGHYGSLWNSLWIDDYNITAFSTNGSQTIITIWSNNATGPFGQSPTDEISLYYGGHWGINVPFGSQIDFRLQAISNSSEYRVFGGWSVIGTVSDWSTVQTITIPDTFTYTASPTPTLAVPEYSWLAILPLFAATFFIAITLRYRNTHRRGSKLQKLRLARQ